MDYSAESLQYLRIAYALMIAGNIAYPAWLAWKWARTGKPGLSR